MADVYEQGECENCSWYNSIMGAENQDNVIYPNMISLNKAKQLYGESKPFEPNLDEFVEALMFYSEVQFKLGDTYYGVILTKQQGKTVTEMFNVDTGDTQTFQTTDDFKSNAKIDGKLLKDIWDQTTDRYWLQ